MQLLDVVTRALESTGIQLVAGAPVSAYDARAPAHLSSRELFPTARSLVVVASAGPWLWRAFRLQASRATWDEPHPLDAYVGSALDCVDSALTRARVGFRRFEPTIQATPALDFRALGEIVGLGSMGPFAMLIHPEHGPWWAMRGAYLVDAEVGATIRSTSPCEGCAAPCVGGDRSTPTIDAATPEARKRCVVGQASRYDDEQIAYHYQRERTLAMLRRR